MKHSFILLLLFSTLISAQKITERPDFEKYFSAVHVRGSFIVMHEKTGDLTVYNPAQLDSGYLPASTFKIFNSLLFLETGMVKDEKEVTPWDGIVRNNPKWDTAQTLYTAFRNSAVWYFQKYAKKTGAKKMKYWLKKAGYGNMDMRGGIDMFWLKGSLRITPRQQIDFLRRLYNNSLPFSARSMDITKKILIYKESDSLVYRGKTGWGLEKNTDIGWWTGYITRGTDTWFFTMCMQNTTKDNTAFPACRIPVAENMLKELGILPKK